MDKDALLFRHQYPPPTPCVWMAISFNMGDRIRLVNAPEELIAPFRMWVSPMLNGACSAGEYYRPDARSVVAERKCASTHCTE
jgi:hypothetical protein